MTDERSSQERTGLFQIEDEREQRDEARLEGDDDWRKRRKKQKDQSGERVSKAPSVKRGKRRKKEGASEIGTRGPSSQRRERKRERVVADGGISRREKRANTSNLLLGYLSRLQGSRACNMLRSFPLTDDMLPRKFVRNIRTARVRYSGVRIYQSGRTTLVFHLLGLLSPPPLSLSF